MEDRIKNLTDKNDVVRFEFDNKQYIVLFAAGKDFWNATMNSAMLMKYCLGSGAKLHTVRDFYFGENRVYLAFHNKQIESIKTKVKRDGYKVLRNDKQLFVIKLKEPVSTKQFREWHRSEEVLTEKIDALLKPSAGTNEVYVLLRRLGRELIMAGEKMKSGAREIIAGRLIDLTIRCFRLQNQIAKKPSEDNRSRLLDILDDIAFLSSIAGDEKLIDNKRLLRIGDILMKLREEVKKLP
jgi:hypothetical protein